MFSGAELVPSKIFTFTTMKDSSMPNCTSIIRKTTVKMITCKVLHQKQKEEKLYDEKGGNEGKQR
uniref:Uncharacterized protein n=1 Tax=Romanomermis culicivorax TaxID=13658 RepID=A0A915KGC5_ROMCU